MRRGVGGLALALVSLAGRDRWRSCCHPTWGHPEPAVFPGSTLLPVVATAPLSVAFLPPEVSLESGLGVESFVALLDSVPSVEDAGALADASDEFFVVSSAGAAAVSSGFCADVSVALPSAAESEEVAVFAGALAADYIRELVDRKEHDPADDLISRLATDYVATGQLNRETAAITGAVMMQAGHETTANMIALGTVALLQHRDVFERLGQTDDQCVIANMVEELVRYLTIVPARWIGWRSKTSTSVVNRSMPATSSS